MRLIVARCEVAYSGRLSAFLPESTRLVMLKEDGSVLVHADAGGYKPLNWMSPPCRLTEEPGRWVVTGKSAQTLTIDVEEILSDSSFELGVDPGLVKDGVESHLQELLAAQMHILGEGWRLVRREYPTAIGPVDLMCRDADGGCVAIEIKRRLASVPGFADLTVVRELGQPSLLVDVNRDKIARYGVNVADVEAVVEAAVGGQAATQVIQGEKLFDLVVRMKPEFRENATQIGNLLVGTPSGQQIPLSELADIHEASGASFIYRENNSRYIGVQYSIEGRDLASAVSDGQRAIADIQKSLPTGYSLSWGGEYSEFLEAKHQMEIIGPLAVLLIFLILFALYGNFKFPAAALIGVILTEPVGALLALKLTGTPFSVSSGLGLLALMGVSVEIVVVMYSYVNKLRLEGMDIRTATREAALLRLRPIMMTALVACLGLLPAALSHGIGSDTQRPFARVIVGGLLGPLFLGIFVYPVLYRLVARENDILQV